jgi:hypothetical protein
MDRAKEKGENRVVYATNHVWEVRRITRRA